MFLALKRLPPFIREAETLLLALKIDWKIKLSAAGDTDQKCFVSTVFYGRYNDDISQI